MTQPYRDKLDYMHAAWCVASVPTMAWAKKVYPESEDALSDLWDAVLKMSRVNEKDANENWNEHRASFDKRVIF